MKRTPSERELFGNQFVAIFNVGIANRHIGVQDGRFHGIDTGVHAAGREADRITLDLIGAGAPVVDVAGQRDGRAGEQTHAGGDGGAAYGRSCPWRTGRGFG